MLAFSCKKDTDGPKSCSEQFVGKWRAYSFERDGAQYLGFQGSGGLNFLELELSNFNAGNNNGDLRVTFQQYGQVPAPPITGLFSPSTDCDRLDTPDFLGGSPTTLRWDVTSLSETRLIIETVVSGFSFEIKLDRI
jgi:hypothetical protein